MNDAAYYQAFYTWLAIFGAIIVAAAILLILIIVAAKRILNLATVALGIVVKIKENTMSIWELQNTNYKAVDILNDADSILSNAGAVATALIDTEK
ncbi:MAG: hypothetical protein ABIT96_03280 [Ferruginibacter sp.]